MSFIEKNIWVLDDTRVTPAHGKYDGANYYPTSRWVLFGRHFAAIAGSGPLIGPVLVNLPDLQSQVGEIVQARPGGAVSSSRSRSRRRS